MLTGGQSHCGRCLLMSRAWYLGITRGPLHHPQERRPHDSVLFLFSVPYLFSPPLLDRFLRFSSLLASLPGSARLCSPLLASVRFCSLLLPSSRFASLLVDLRFDSQDPIPPCERVFSSGCFAVVFGRRRTVETRYTVVYRFPKIRRTRVG